MSDTVEKLQLIVDTGNGAVLSADLATKVDLVTAAGDRLRDAQGRFVAQGDRATASTETFAAATEHAAASAGKATAANAKLARSAEDSGKSLNQARQGFVDISRAAQDFAQGGFGGILNNLEGIGRAIPALLKNPTALLTSIPAILTTVGTALYMFGGQVYSAFRGFALGANEIPKATDALGRIDGRLGDVTKQLEKYREAQKLTNAELADYNKLSAEQVRLEMDKARALADAARAKKFNEENIPKDEDERQRADLFKGTMGDPGQRQEFARSIETALPQDRRRAAEDKLQRALREQGENFGSDPLDLVGNANRLEAEVKKARAAVDAENKRRIAEANKLAADAVTGGNAAATDRIRALQAQRPDAFTDYQRYAVENADPTRARKEQADIEGQRRQAALDKDLKAKAEAEKKKAEQEAKDREQKQKKERDEQDKIDDEVAKRRVANPEQTVALLGPQALADARGRVGGDHADGGHRVGGHAPVGGGAGAPRDEVAQAPTVAPVIDDRFRGLTGTRLKNAKRAAMLKARKETRDREQMKRMLSGADKKPLQATVIPRDKAAPTGPQDAAIKAQRAQDAARKKKQAEMLERSKAADKARREANAARFNKVVAQAKPSVPSTAPRDQNAWRPTMPENAHPSAPGPPARMHDQAALGGVEATQQAMVATQNAVGMALARIARIEANAARLGQNATRLGQQAREQQHSALNSGAGIA